MPRRSREDQTGVWHHRTLHTPGLAKGVKVYLVRFFAGALPPKCDAVTLSTRRSH